MTAFQSHDIELTVLGSSSGFPTRSRRSPSVHLRCGGVTALLDCGEGASGQMVHLGLPVSEIDIILISHMHADHIGGLVQLVQTWQIGQWEGYTKQGYHPMVLAPAEGVEPLTTLLSAAYLMPEIIAPLRVDFVAANTDLPSRTVYADSMLEVAAVANSHLAGILRRFPDLASKYPAQRCQAVSYALTFVAGERRVVYSGDLGQLEEMDRLISPGVDMLIVELAHYSAEALVSYLSERRERIGAVLVNHIGPRYDRNGPELECLARKAGLSNVFVGEDGRRLVV